MEIGRHSRQTRAEGLPWVGRSLYLPCTETNPFPYMRDSRVIQANFRPIFGPEGSRPDQLYGKDMIFVQVTACTENQGYRYGNLSPRIFNRPARRRLTEADLKELGRNMAARRGIVYPG